MIKLILSKISLTLGIACLFTTSSMVNLAQAGIVYNYGDENLTNVKKAYSQGNLHILQIGDSHTAGDYFTEQLRKRLQAEISDGGIGFAYPAKLKGQRDARHGYDSVWETDNSRFNKEGGNYPIGGVFAFPNNADDELTLTSQYYDGDTQRADIMVYGRKGQQFNLASQKGRKTLTLSKSGWQSVPTSITFPTKITADTGLRIGGFWLKRSTGGRVSAMGLNGATQDYWQRWHSDLSKTLAFSKANLVVLAYGTNEAFRSSADDLTDNMNSAIKTIRQGLPNATILIVGAPESLKNTDGNCGERAPSLDSVQNQLQNVAKKNNTLYWSWQEAMGGLCSMNTWVEEGLAARDGVHFTRSGYNRAANDLYTNLKTLLDIKNSISTPVKQEAYEPTVDNSVYAQAEPYHFATSANFLSMENPYLKNFNESLNSYEGDRFEGYDNSFREFQPPKKVCNIYGRCYSF